MRLFWCVLLLIGMVGASLAAKPTLPSFMSLDDLEHIESLLNYPIDNQEDMAQVYQACQSLLLTIHYTDDPSEYKDLARVIREIAAITNPKIAPGERVDIVPFATSRDRGICAMRDEIGIAAPPGGAVIRTYRSPQQAPEVFQSVLINSTGMTLPCRFIALNRERTSTTATSYCLITAYLYGAFGSDYLSHYPDWFVPSIAEYFSGNKPVRYNEETESMRYFAELKGRDSVIDFVHAVLEGKNANRTIFLMTGYRGYYALADAALAVTKARVIRAARIQRFGLIGLSLAFLVLIGVWFVQQKQRATTARTLDDLDQLKAPPKPDSSGTSKSTLQDCTVTTSAECSATDPSEF